MRAVYALLVCLLSGVVSLKASGKEPFRAVYETYGNYMKENKEGATRGQQTWICFDLGLWEDDQGQ